LKDFFAEPQMLNKKAGEGTAFTGLTKGICAKGTGAMHPLSAMFDVGMGETLTFQMHTPAIPSLRFSKKMGAAKAFRHKPDSPVHDETPTPLICLAASRLSTASG